MPSRPSGSPSYQPFSATSLSAYSAPAFGERGDAAEHACLAEARQAGVLLLERDLEVMTRAPSRDTRACADRTSSCAASRSGIWKIAGPRAVERRAIVVGRGARFAEPRERLRDHFGSSAACRTATAERFERILDEAVGVLHDRRARGFGRRIGIAQVAAQLLDALAHRAVGTTELLQDRIHLSFDVRDLLQADLVDLLRRVVGGGEAVEEEAYASAPPL